MIPDEVYVIDKMVREEMACKPCPAGDTTLEIYTKKRTNFDRITASPEALASWLTEHTRDILHDVLWSKYPMINVFGDDATKENVVLAWLKQESDTE